MPCDGYAGLIVFDDDAPNTQHRRARGRLARTAASQRRVVDVPVDDAFARELRDERAWR